MGSFTARTSAEAVITASPEQVWEALIDPALVARCTPFVRRIDASGDVWTWYLTGLKVAGVGLSPEFTERMTFVEGERIEFRHDPPAGVPEKAGVSGWYAIDPAEGGTRLRTEMSISVELPLPRAAGGAVRAGMGRVIDQMGERFSARLLDHLGASRL